MRSRSLACALPAVAILVFVAACARPVSEPFDPARTVAEASRAFLAGLALFHTAWTDLQAIPLGPAAAVASFFFRDSIVTRGGETIRQTGTTTIVWERRDGEWRVVFGDADHAPL